MRWNITEIKRKNREVGHYYFDRKTMEFFRSRVLPKVYQGPGGIFFVTSEQFIPTHGDPAPRAYTVRRFDPETGHIQTEGPFNALDRETARSLAKERASHAT